MAVRADSMGAASTLAPISHNVIRLHPGGCPEGVEPRRWRKTLKSRVRTHLAIVTGLLALLDDMDGDCDIEDDGDVEYSSGVDSPEATMTEWSEEHPIQTVPEMGL
ncbi:hypothetical protein [Devosia sp.]|uniref:hypothetical protein n=1 Tax=Devosia sp. TaxID=1871048 RepID=UPI001ACCB9DB|nr:hypothetical protein [Devosia sp.]MBN9308997.1 hypothetical protein [Devosia sp.]